MDYLLGNGSNILINLVPLFNLSMNELPIKLNKIAIVEDEIIICKVFEVYFNKYGVFDVNIFQNGDSFLNSVPSVGPFDLILMDIQLGPGKNGIEIAKELRNIANSPILFTTGNAFHQSTQATEEISNSLVVSKPIDFKKFSHYVNKVLQVSKV